MPESITPDVSFSTESVPTCYICNAIPPSGTKLNACGSCDDALLCGHCALTHTFPHSSKCDLLRASLHYIDKPPDGEIVMDNSISPVSISSDNSMTQDGIRQILNEIMRDLRNIRQTNNSLTEQPK